ncbi:hypothetical protein NPIL_215281 [Nephila pilipes]|uniref:Uncharacterized protein n=1 Tax=Nephila pilipes TaxID=299642 RepID=A0A8X6NXJ7_NEPPI|nr:hypothetical protein NPIL_215281 [Nephila pilipes]
MKRQQTVSGADLPHPKRRLGSIKKDVIAGYPQEEGKGKKGKRASVSSAKCPAFQDHLVKCTDRFLIHGVGKQMLPRITSSFKVLVWTLDLESFLMCSDNTDNSKDVFTTGSLLDL